MLQHRRLALLMLLASAPLPISGCGRAGAGDDNVASEQPNALTLAAAPSDRSTEPLPANSPLKKRDRHQPVAEQPAAVSAEELPGGGTMVAEGDAQPLRIAFISYANPQQVARDIEPIVQYLTPAVGVPIRGFVTLDYGSSIESMRNKQTDLAFVDPLAFMMAHEQIGAEPLLLEIYSGGASKYHSCIWVRKDSGIKKLTDLKGKTIAFADQIDMSGHLLPRDIFERKALLPQNQPEKFFKQTYFAGGDEQAIRAVLNKFVDAAGVSQYANLLLRLQERDEVTSLATSIDSPSHLLMARKGLSKELTGRIKKALLSLDVKVTRDKAILDGLYGVQGYAEAKLSDFSEVAKLAARFGFVKNPKLFAAKGNERQESTP